MPMQGFYVEIRLRSYAKSESKRLIWDISKKFNVRGMTSRRPVPHITLIPPSRTNDFQKVRQSVERVCSSYNLVPFEIVGFGCFENTKVVFFRIEASEDMKRLRLELCRELNTHCQLPNNCWSYDYPFHATLAFKDLTTKFERVWQYVSSRPQPRINQHLLRVTVLGSNRKILFEYDLMQKRTLSRREALSSYQWGKTISRLQKRIHPTYMATKPQENRNYNVILVFLRKLFSRWR